MRLRQFDLGFVVGLFEGEGSICTPNRNPRNVELAIQMTDEDTVRRVFKIMKIGKLYGPYGPYPKSKMTKPTWHWVVQRREDSRTVLKLLLPYLGERRAARAQEALAGLDTK